MHHPHRISDSLANDLADQSIHFDLVRKTIPSWLSEASLSRITALKTDRVSIPDWQANAAQALQERLKQGIKLGWTAQNDVDRAVSELQDVYAFAKPLLQQALKDRFGVEEDVEEIWLRLYAPAKTSWWVHDFSGGTTSRTVSLLDAALHNFSRDETFTQDSEFITRPDARGHFGVVQLKHKLSIEQFKSLCRELDIGAQYQQHLNEFLLPHNRVASNVLRHKVTLSHKAALNIAAHMALMKNDIEQDAFDVVQGLLDDRKDLRWNGRSIDCYNLSMMDIQLTGIVLIIPDTNAATGPVPLIAYVPHDPQHPLKQYPSSLEFMAELTRQLRDASAPKSYQQFFSQFVPHQQRGDFFAGLNDRLSKVKWQPATPGSNLPSWRETPVDNPNLQFSLSSVRIDRETVFKGDLWGYFHRQKINKVLNDARDIAISTEYADRMARWAWWDNLEKMLSDILNAALLVATPLVPGMGELMLAYTAYQLTNEVVEGIVDLAEGRLAEAGEQTIGVLESIVQLGAFAAAGAIGNAARAKLSPFFEGLKPVQSTDGRTRLWNPDLGPYQQSDLALPTDAKPDAQGIYQHQGQQILQLNDQLFAVQTDPVTGQHRIQHPQRPDAYTPNLRHNSHGAWVSETENPREWEGTTLMRRLGHTTDAFNDVQLERIRLISGTEEAALRRMHVDNAPPPPLLTDTLQQLGATVNPPVALSPDITLLFSDFPELPAQVVENIMAGATPSELQHIERKLRLPLRLKTQARELQFEVQSVRAAQGLYLDALSNIDTERLALGALRLHTDMFGDLRIEIRQGTLDGELRCSAGPEDATQVRVLIRDNSGKYQVRDASNQSIHDADVFFEALLHAMGSEGKSALGYKPGDAEHFRQWVIVKSAPSSERRTVLATPPIRPIVEHETMLLVRGGGLSKEGKTLHERIQDLHPHFSEAEVDTFANALIEKGEPMKLLEEQENDLDQLRKLVDLWEIQSAGLDADNPIPLRGVRQHIAKGLLDCFERKNTNLGSRTDPHRYALDLSENLLPLDLESGWPERPQLKRFLDKVTILKLDNTRFSGKANGLLKDFPNLRELSASRCELTGLPEHIGTMHRLERLRLSDNEIVLDAPAVEKLKHLTYLEILKLDENPLGRSVDISLMPRLKVVGLRDTVIMTWPKGVLSNPRPRGFLLDLRDNPISLIPNVVSGTPEAWVVGRTRLDVGNLSEPNQLLYQEIRRSMELPPEPIVPSNTQAELMISSNYSADHWNDVPGWGVDRANLWSELIDEPKAERFMTVLLNTKDTADYRAGGRAQDQLLKRVWRMLDAVHVDTRLREKLFTMAIAPVDCADAGAQLFNHMGINVLASEAYSYSIDAAELEQKLVTLAKGAARLEQVNDIARADVASRGGNPDEVEIYLAYQTGLAQRLGLPWQSEGMLYRPVSGVTDSMIDQAYDTVLALGEGDGLINKILEQDFWESYLREKWPVDTETNKHLYQSKYEKLEELRTTQFQWLESTSDVQKADLRNRLRELMNDLPVPETVVFADEPISEANFDRMLSDLGDSEKELARRLTRAALRKAGQ
ncbi:dermonecrotic toxin domain-containing protein [Pseudomonas fluorescens]|uniref:dermonecrotic toxin domain-containing protein n=1 Tax=Pseudomonas fluorescens TaxID=294 RepID=UPI003C13C129